MPEMPMLARCRFPEERAILSNGLRLVTVRRPHLPIVSATLLIPAGVARERPGEAGLAALTAGLITLGTSRGGAQEIAGEVDALGASLGVVCDYDFALAGMSCLARDTGRMLELLAEVVLDPAFAEEEIERRRSDVLSLLERRRDDPGNLVRDRFIARLYGDHPYHHPRDGFPETVGSFGRGDLVRFYRSHFRPEDAILAVVGDLEAAAVRAQVRDLFVPWGGSPDPGPPPPPVAEPAGAAFDRLQKDGMTQAVLRVGNLALRRDDPDYLAAVVMNFILGGAGPGCRLMRSLREERGLVYEVHSNVHPRRAPGYFFATARARAESAVGALGVLRAEIDAMLDAGITEQELDLARRFFTGSLPLALETNDQLATNVLSREFYGLEPEFWLRDIERIVSLTRAEVNAAARRVIRPGRFVTVVGADFRRVGPGFPDPAA